MCTDTQYPSVVKEEPAFLCTVSVYSLVYPVYVRVRLKLIFQPPLVHGTYVCTYRVAHVMLFVTKNRVSKPHLARPEIPSHAVSAQLAKTP